MLAMVLIMHQAVFASEYVAANHNSSQYGDMTLARAETGADNCKLSTVTRQEEGAVDTDWRPTAIEYDWIQLSSDEWLKGKTKSMYQKVLTFDSDKLKLLDIKWKDVRVLRSYRSSSVNIDGHGSEYGQLEVTGSELKILNGDSSMTFDRSRLISFVPGGEKESDFWVVNISLGLDLKTGNTNQYDYTAKANIKRRASRTKFEIDYIGNVSNTNGVNGELTETINNHRVTADFVLYKTRYFFFTPIFVEFFRDPFLNIDIRSTAGTGLGYSFIDEGKTELTVMGGPAYMKTEFISVEADNSGSRSDGALVVRTYYKTDIFSTLDFITRYNIQYSDQESGGYTHHAIATFKQEIRGELDFDVSLIWDRVSNPTTDANGSTPVPDDYRFTLGLSYTY